MSQFESNNSLIDINTITTAWQAFSNMMKLSKTQQQVLLETAHISSAPKVLEIGLTTKCNYNCPYCFNHADNTYNYLPNKELAPDKILKLLDDYNTLNTVAFGTSGEPFLYKHLFTILDGLKDKKAKFAFSTNGGLIDETLVNKLQQYDIEGFTISCDASDDDTYRRFTNYGNLNQFKKSDKIVITCFSR